MTQPPHIPYVRPARPLPPVFECPCGWKGDDLFFDEYRTHDYEWICPVCHAATWRQVSEVHQNVPKQFHQAGIVRDGR